MSPRARPTSREAIIDAAVYTLARNPGASLSEIALRAGVGRATLHRHFQSREALLREIALECMTEMESAVLARLEAGAGARQRLAQALEVVIPMGDRFHFLNYSPRDDEAVNARYRRQLAWLTELVEALKAEGEISTEVPTTWAMAQIDNIIWTAWNEVSAGRVAPVAAPDLAVRSLLEGMK